MMSEFSDMSFKFVMLLTLVCLLVVVVNPSKHLVHLGNVDI
jgi:hypothetical protein